MNQQYKSLEVDNLKNLAERQYEHIEPLVENLLPGKGVYLFCGASKIGKSYLAFDLGLHICSGKKFWNYDVNQTDVLYLCLEDDDESLQERMFSIAEEYSENFYFATGETFQPEHYIEQLDEQMQKHPDIGLIIEELYRSDHCSTQSEFIEKCINYYTGYIRADRNMNFLSYHHVIYPGCIG